MPRPTKSGIRGYSVDPNGTRRIDLRYRDAEGRPQRWRETFPPGTPARAAELRAKEVLAAAVNGTLQASREARPMTLGDACEEYLRGESSTDKTRHLTHFRTVLGDDFPIGDVNAFALERYKRTRRQAGAANATINRELHTIKHFLGRSVEYGWIESRPKVGMLEEPPGRVRWLSDAERARLAVALAKPRRDHMRRLVEAALLSGARLSNLVGLRVQDVDFQSCTMTFTKTKTGKRQHVPISPALETVLREAMATPRNPGVEAVFVSATGNAHKRGAVSNHFRKLVAEAKIDDFHFHDLRHDFATRVRRGGHGLDVIQALLGHAHPAMTQRYAHIGRDELARAVDSASGLIRGLKKGGETA